VINELFKKFVEFVKLERAAHAKIEEQKTKGNAQFRRKGSVPLINRSVSFSASPISAFSQAEVPRLIIEGDGGFGKSSLLRFIRDISIQEKFSVW